ncbi:hypothetical protein IFM89_038667 [Coptis chinensis]|uniref:Uncharacterized protein n=1 Tax=Coptis chinensis TaxID=261450 RepID=A0A835I434_9MAGN|nr:hypothetical protein IFM89_038667 [Coptis chinensis]
MTSSFFTILLAYSSSFIKTCQAQNFHYYLLRVQWGPSVCSSAHCRISPQTEFTLHGLWPQNGTGSQPLDCKPQDKFSLVNVQNLQTDLIYYWPDLYTTTPRSNHRFWAHEWAEHGSCSGLDQYTFSNDALAVFRRIDFLAVLQLAHINPGGQYSPQTIVNAFSGYMGLDPPMLYCKRNSMGNQMNELRSLFERLSSMGCPKHLLDMQYRMHPKISCFPNLKFYQEKVLDAPNVKSQSYEKHYLPAWEVSKQKISIGIISPYATQVAAIQEKFGKI